MDLLEKKKVMVFCIMWYYFMKHCIKRPYRISKLSGYEYVWETLLDVEILSHVMNYIKWKNIYFTGYVSF